MDSHASAAKVVPFVTSKSTILSGVPYAEQILRLSKNHQVCSLKRTSVPTGLHQCHGRVAAAWPETPLQQTRWHLPMSPSAPRSQAAQRRQALRGKSRSMSVCLHLIYLFQQPLRHSALSMKLDTHSCPNWEGVFRQSQTILESLSFFFSASPFSYKDFLNEVAFRGIFNVETGHVEQPLQSVFNLMFLILGIINTEGKKTKNKTNKQINNNK